MIDDKWNKLQNVCYRLNHEASKQRDRWGTYSKGIGIGAKHFYPCDKASVIIREMGKYKIEDLPVVEIMMLAYNEYCGCHGDMYMFIPFTEFQAWQLDNRYKLVHYGELP